MNPQELPIRDIKPLLPIPDISIYFFIVIVGITIVVFIAVLIFIWKWWQKHKTSNPRIEWLRELDRMDYSNSKKVAYIMTKYGRLLAEDKRREEILEQLIPRLEKYKYKKDVPPLDDETKRYIKLFIEMSHDAL
ncbi:hypothetical protein [Hydrogenimonas thermophila]|uniref:DUF4381 domain-containing protein n=1 Tax=Hydrogenimonas thermophila TaxID=223786 RepID=A0A1I5SY13_9BACT|nr:hypothetical protein [Hydrogenimonas thermophila]SFP75684.1 hypothetical protein SAMN05216234_13821 [Hydrogenimonas thermophila]